MTDNEMLLAISNMLEPIKKDIRGVKDDIIEIREDIQGVKNEVNGIKNEVNEIKDKVKKIELTQENAVLPRLNTIESCYTSTYNRYVSGVPEIETLKFDMEIVKKVLMEHSEKLQNIS